MQAHRYRNGVLLTAALVVLASAGRMLFAGARSDMKPRRAPVASYAASALLIDAVAVEDRSVQMKNALSGTVQPYHIATVAAEVANRIVARPIEQGDHVAAGTLMASLDADAATTALSQARDSYDQAVAARRQAETDYTRAAIETDADRQQARAQVAQALAEERRAEAQRDQSSADERKAHSLTRAQELQQARAALAQTQSDERLARIEYDRYTFLVRQGAAPQQALDRAQATLEADLARRQSAEEALSLAQEGARREDQEAAVAQVSAAAAQVDAATQQVRSARAALRVADTRDTRLAVIRRQIDGLRAQEAQAVDAVRQAQIALDRRTVRAPFAGRILAVMADAGDMMSVGSPIARLGEVDRVKVTFAVPESARPTLQRGQQMRLTADALPGQVFHGRITALGFQADTRTRAFPIEITVDNPGERLLPNMVARLELPVGTSARRLLIPDGAVATDGDTSYVFVIAEGRATRRDVRLGAPIGDQVEVTQGLVSGERIAATPQRLSDGAPVRIASDSESAIIRSAR